MCLLWRCPVRRGAQRRSELFFFFPLSSCAPQLPHGFLRQRRLPPNTSPLPGQLGDLLALACETPSRGMEPEPGIGEASARWEGSKERRRGLCRRVDIMKNYPVAGSVIKLSSGAFFFFFLKGGFNKRECEVVATGYSLFCVCVQKW